jgi:hypothetical protein
VRGGNDAAGELVARCANARGRPSDERSATTGFRCCAGPRTDAKVELELKTGPVFEKASFWPDVALPPVPAIGNVACGPPNDAGVCSLARLWTWRPVANVVVWLSGGCVGRDPSARCGLVVWRMLGDKLDVLGDLDTGREVPEVVLVQGHEHRVRVRGANARGPFFKELFYAYGRVEVKDPH